MKPEYIEGQKATRNFEQGMSDLFKVPKDAVVKAEKKEARLSRARRARKQKKKQEPDKD